MHSGHLSAPCLGSYPDTWSNQDPAISKPASKKILSKPSAFADWLNRPQNQEPQLQSHDLPHVCLQQSCPPSSQKDGNWYRTPGKHSQFRCPWLCPGCKFMYLYARSSFISWTSGKVSSNETPMEGLVPMLPSVPDSKHPFQWPYHKLHLNQIPGFSNQLPLPKVFRPFFLVCQIIKSDWSS